MRIAYVAGIVIPSQRYSSIQVINMCNEFNKQGNEVYLIGAYKNLSNDDIKSHYNIKASFDVIYFEKERNRIINSFIALKYIKNLQPDIVYTHNEIVAALSSKVGFKTLFESHIPTKDKDNFFKVFFYNNLLKHKNLERMIVKSKLMKNYYMNFYDINGGDILIAKGGAKASNQKISPCSFSKNGELQIGCFVESYENMERSAIKYLAQKSKFGHFHIFEQKQNKINSLTKQLDNVTYHGYVPTLLLKKYILSCDVIIFPPFKGIMRIERNKSKRWIPSLAIFESMASKKPIICSNISVFKEILKHKKTGFLCNPTNLDEWLDSLKRLRNIEFRNKIGLNAKKYLLNNYTWEKRANKIISTVT